MTEQVLRETTLGIKRDTLECWSLYNKRISLGDITSSSHQYEHLIALDVYIRCLDYFLGVWEHLEEIEVTENNIRNTIEAAISCIVTFKPVYYEY